MKTRFTFALLFTVLGAAIATACSDEIVAGGEPIILGNAQPPSSQSSTKDEDGGLFGFPVGTTIPSGPDRILEAGVPNMPNMPSVPGLLDGSVIDARVPPLDLKNVECLATTETEGNDDPTSANPLSKRTCGIVIQGDLDFFFGQSGSSAKTLTFVAAGDAELTLSGFGFNKTLRNGESIGVPSFGVSVLGFEVSVRTPTGTAQAYRIDFE